MWQSDYYILPVVKRTAGVVADILRYSLLTCAVLALAEPVLLVLRLPMPGILSGMVSSFLLQWSIAVLAVLALWCHPVLLAGQGVMITRWLVPVSALLAPLVPVCWVYSLATGELLLYRQAELPIILGIVLVVTALINIPKMAAAPWQLQVRVVAVPLLLLVAYGCDMPGIIVYSLVCKLLAAWLAFRPLKMLASLAPRIISMPETD